jgi:hypothetical protein
LVLLVAVVVVMAVLLLVVVVAIVVLLLAVVVAMAVLFLVAAVVMAVLLLVVVVAMAVLLLVAAVAMLLALMRCQMAVALSLLLVLLPETEMLSPMQIPPVLLAEAMLLEEAVDARAGLHMPERVEVVAVAVEACDRGRCRDETGCPLCPHWPCGTSQFQLCGSTRHHYRTCRIRYQKHPWFQQQQRQKHQRPLLHPNWRWHLWLRMMRMVTVILLVLRMPALTRTGKGTTRCQMLVGAWMEG